MAPPVNKVKNLWFPKMRFTRFTVWEHFSFSRKTQLHEVNFFTLKGMDAYYYDINGHQF